MAIALTPFQALCGFRRPSELQAYLDDYPELCAVIGSDGVSRFRACCESSSDETRREGYKAMFQGFMSTSDEVANQAIAQLIARISSASTRTALEEVIVHLNLDYPNDRGIFCPLLLNYLTLNVGECFFMGPNEPHAYLSGDCVECMALSDNVVRAGLTPKLKDVPTLVNMLHYRYGEPAILPPVMLDSHTALYRPPADAFPEFEVEKISLAELEVYEPTPIPAASIIIIVDAGNEATAFTDSNAPLERKELSIGSVLFVSANSSISLNSGHASLTVYRAHINLGSA
jgi:mannose-6-phosphate isomerase